MGAIYIILNKLLFTSFVMIYNTKERMVKNESYFIYINL